MARQIASAAINAARDAHYELNPVTGLYERTLLLEGARTNICSRSEEFSVWTNTGFTFTTGQVDPMGGTSATTLTDVDSGATASLGRGLSGGAFTGDGTKVLSLYVKQGTLATFRVSLRDTTAAVIRHTVLVTWSSGVPVLTTSVGAGTRHAVETLSNGWFRIAFNADGVLAANTHGVEIYAGSVAADTGTVTVFGAQAEDGTFPTSYIPATTVAVTRAADSLSLPFTLPPQEMTVYAKFIERGTGQIASARILQLGSSAAGNTNSLRIIGDAAGRFAAVGNNGVDSSTSLAGAVAAIGDLVEARMTYSGAGIYQMHAAVNGAAETSGATSATTVIPAFAAAQLHLGHNGSAMASGFAAFQSVKVARGTKTLAEMRAL